MAYGRKVSADNTSIPPEVGIVENVSIDSQFKISDDGNYATITFFQQNGSKVDRRIYDSVEEDEQELTDRVIKHICTKIVSQSAYEKAFEQPVSSFLDFINRVNKLIAGKTNGLKFRMIFHYNNKGYVTVSKYPNFIERMDTEETKLVISKYVQGFLTRPAQPKSDDAEAEHAMAANAGAEDELPF